MSLPLFFECTLMYRPYPGAKMRPCEREGVEFSTTVAARSTGAARYKFFRTMRELCYTVLDGDDSVDVGFQHIRVRRTSSLSMPQLAAFAHTAGSRGLPFARIGMEVVLSDGRRGRIIGRNDSANFQVLFENGTELNCHPRWQIAYFGPGGEVLADFRGAA